MTASLVTPNGGELVDGLVGAARARELLARSPEWPSWYLSPREVCDLELLLNGGFSPLVSFLDRADYESVCRDMRLASGALWPIPIALPVDRPTAEAALRLPLTLRAADGTLLAVLNVEEVWERDLAAEGHAVFGTDDPGHPGLQDLKRVAGLVCVSGRLEGLSLPSHHDFRPLRHTPRTLRAAFASAGWSRIVAFQTRNPLHRAHFELTRRAAEASGCRLLVHPVVGTTAPGDVDHYTRVRCYEAVMGRYPEGTAMLSLLPLSMRMAGPREALWHAIVRRNHGCSHFIVGRDHAGPMNPANGRPFYGPYAAQELVRRHEAELGVTMVPFPNLVYVPAQDTYLPEDEVPGGSTILSLSGTELRRRLTEGREIPEWFTFPEVAARLTERFPGADRRGVVILLTGLPSSGKSTLANVLTARLLERTARTVTLLDGDLVRQHLSSELGFSREHRDLNIRRIGFVAAEVARHGGVAICAPIAPYDTVRKDVRRMADEAGAAFLLVYVEAPAEVCEERDPKGLYRRARAGLLPQFTGVSDPYELPNDAEVTVATDKLGPEEAADAVWAALAERGLVATWEGTMAEEGLTSARRT